MLPVINAAEPVGILIKWTLAFPRHGRLSLLEEVWHISLLVLTTYIVVRDGALLSELNRCVFVHNHPLLISPLNLLLAHLSLIEGSHPNEHPDVLLLGADTEAASATSSADAAHPAANRYTQLLRVLLILLLSLLHELVRYFR